MINKPNSFLAGFATLDFTYDDCLLICYAVTIGRFLRFSVVLISSQNQQILSPLFLTLRVAGRELSVLSVCFRKEPPRRKKGMFWIQYSTFSKRLFVQKALCFGILRFTLS